MKSSCTIPIHTLDYADCRWIEVTTDIMLIFADGSELLQISWWFLQMDRSYYRYHVDFCRWIGVTTDIMLIFADGSELLQISCWFLQMDRSYYRYHVDFCRGITSINQLNMLSLF